jgi:SAM-dependent methyltransferase
MSQDLDQQRRKVTAALRERGELEDIIVRAIDLLARSWPDGLEAMAADELLAVSLGSFPVFPVWFEQRMTAARRQLLFAPQTPGAGPLLAAIAIQCQLNEYAWAEDAAETARIADLCARGADLTPEEAMALACYRPLAAFDFADDLLAKAWSGPAAEVLDEQVTAVREELETAASIPAVTPIREGVSSNVRSQYEEHPYPRWRRITRVTATRVIQGRPAPVRPRVLVAGCGTGRQAIQAHEWLGAEHTVAVDLSRRSLAYAARKTRELGVQGIEYLHGDILELPEHYPEAFDVVTSVGVLHHMSDPFEGVRAVCRTLKPGGLLNIGLYSQAARAGLRPAQELARRYTPQTVRELRQDIIARPDSDPVRAPVGSRDFYASSSCRDLLMHVQEHQMRFADLRRMLDENGLRFLGFILTDSAMAEYRAAFPHDPEGVDLNAWEQFEICNPRIFGRMYAFWAEKPDRAEGVQENDAGAVAGGLESWRRPNARSAVLEDLGRGLRGVQPTGHAAAVYLKANWPSGDAALGSDELLASLLRSTPVYPYWLEGRLTTIRRRLLIGNDVEALKPILPALALQCFLNEYVWAEDAIERRLVQRLADRIERLEPDEVMTLACYRPLARIPGAEALLARGWSGPVAEVLQEQLVAVREEQDLCAGIPTLTPIRGGVSEPEREAGPGRRWRRVTPLPPVPSILGWSVPERPEVLLAGCGTGFQAIHAGQRYGAGARILAIDLSRANLAYALRKSREAGLANFEYAQADLLELGGLGRSFDVIESGGALHHLADPFEGVRALTGVLKPGGILKLGLYSRAARERWAPARALARSYSPGAIRELREAIVRAPDGDPVRAVMATTDFYAASTLHDLLMDARENAHDIGDIRRILGETGLEFLGFTPSAAALAAYRAAYPADPKALDLDNWEALERRDPHTFVGMYQFWVRKPA